MIETDGTDRRFVEAKEKVTQWLISDGWKVTDHPSSQAAWRIVAEDSQQKRIALGQISQKPDLLIVQGSLAWTDEVRFKAQLLSLEKREELLWDLRFQLLNMGVKFDGVDSSFKSVEILTNFYLEGLRRNEFSERVSRVQDALLAAGWIVHRRLGQPAETANGGTLLS